MLDSDVTYLSETKNVTKQEVIDMEAKIARIQFLKWWCPKNKNDDFVKTGDKVVYMIEKARAESKGYIIPEKVLNVDFKAVRKALEKAN